MAQKNKGIVAAFISDRNKEKAVMMLCVSLSIEYKKLGKHDFEKGVGEIFKLNIAKDRSGASEKVGADLGSDDSASIKPQITSDLLIFYGLSDEHLDHFLKGYKERAIKPIAYKAVVTPTNASWSLYKLYANLEQEHTKMTLGI